MIRGVFERVTGIDEPRFGTHKGQVGRLEFFWIIGIVRMQGPVQFISHHDHSLVQIVIQQADITVDCLSGDQVAARGWNQDARQAAFGMKAIRKMHVEFSNGAAVGKVDFSNTRIQI